MSARHRRQLPRPSQHTFFLPPSSCLPSAPSVSPIRLSYHLVLLTLLLRQSRQLYRSLLFAELSTLKIVEGERRKFDGTAMVILNQLLCPSGLSVYLSVCLR